MAVSPVGAAMIAAADATDAMTFAAFAASSVLSAMSACLDSMDFISPITFLEISTAMLISTLQLWYCLTFG